MKFKYRHLNLSIEKLFELFLEEVFGKDKLDLFKKKNLNYENKVSKLSKKFVLKQKMDWFNEQEKRCVKCNSTEELTLDHIIPIVMYKTIGIEEENIFEPNNYQILCKKCNTLKSHRLDFTNPKTKILLKELLNYIN